MGKKAIVSIILVFLLAGCVNESTSSNNEMKNEFKLKIEQLEMENEQLKDQILESGKDLEGEMAAFRETMNLTFKFFAAMNQKDFEFIGSIASSNVQVNEVESTLYFAQDNYTYKMTDTAFLLENLEYRFYSFETDKVSIGFAEYFFEGHSTIDFTFIKEDGQWKVDYVVTNA